MLTISGKDIRSAAIYSGKFHSEYKSYIQTKAHLQPGFGIEFEDFGALGNFLTSLGSQAAYNYHSSNVATAHTTPDDARLLSSDLQIDPLGSGLIAYFPGWELSDD